MKTYHRTVPFSFVVIVRWLMVQSVAAFNVQRFLPKTSSITRVSSCLYSSTKRSYKKRRDGAEFGKSSTNLGWENYEFGENPKIDNRFGSSKSDLASGVELCAEEEAKNDREAAKKLQSSQDAFMSLDPDTVQRAREILEPFINEDRLEKVQTVLKQRTKRSKFLFENVSAVDSLLMHSFLSDSSN